MKRICLLFFSWLLLCGAQAVEKVGEWELYATFRTPRQICEGNRKVFFLADNSLFSYGKDDEEVRELSRLNVLSDNNIDRIAGDFANDVLVVAYANGNIDLIDMATEAAYNIPYIKNATLTTSKRINDITFVGDEAYLATDFGIVVLDDVRKEIKATYTFNEKIYAATCWNGYIYCVRADRYVYRCAVDDIPYDVNHWEVLTPNQIDKMLPSGERLLLLSETGNVYLFSPSEQNKWLCTDGKVKKIELTRDGFLLHRRDNKVVLYDSANSLVGEMSFDDTGYQSIDVTCTNTQNVFWLLGEDAVAALKYEENSFREEKMLSCDHYQKVYDPFSITIAGERIYVSPAGISYLNNAQDVAGYISILENGSWTTIYPQDIPHEKHPTTTWGNTYNVAVDPDDPDVFYIGTWLEGLYRFKNNVYDKHWNDTNSAIIGSSSKWSFKAGRSVFDKKKNLYMTTFCPDYGLVMMKRDGSWVSFPYEDLKNLRNLDYILMPQHSSAMWIVYSGYDSFIFVFDANGTDDIGDDKIRKFTTFTDQNGEQIDGHVFYEIVEDKTGQLWLGTDRGPIVLTNPSKYMNGNFTCTRIKIARNDGTNLADYLLNDEVIQTIAIDGANRKWFGTASSGVYLVSEDGQETIYHFTAENSPLPSDNIYDIAVHPETGEVFFATSNGLASFRAEATEPQDDFSDVYVYPNPVRPDYDGYITVTGLQEHSLVKITDTAGNLIYQDFSTGGQLVWDGRTRDGKRLHSGIYLVFASVNDGKEGTVAKFTVVR